MIRNVQEKKPGFPADRWRIIGAEQHGGEGMGNPVIGLPGGEAERSLAEWIARKASGVPRLLVTLDGPCASGKTTLAGKLAQALSGAVVHTDDYVIPHALKTPERLAVPGGNCDADRLAEEIVIPFKSGLPVRYRRYDCRNDVLLPEEPLPDTRVLILEGSYCNLPVLRRHADVRLFLDAPWEVREARLLGRESAASLQRFHDLWIPLEDAYFAAYHLPEGADLLLRSGADGRLDFVPLN